MTDIIHLDEFSLGQKAREIRDQSTQVVADLVALQAVVDVTGDITATLATLTTDITLIDTLAQDSVAWAVRANTPTPPPT